jgi:hypothetical protein
MTYRVGSLNSTPAKDLVDRLSADLVLNGWVVVENDYVEGTYTWDVLRSPAANNSAGNEFFIAIGYLTTGQTTMAWTAMKEWNTTTKRATRFLPNTAILVPDALGYNPQGAVALPSTGTQIAFRTITLATGDSYYYSVTNDRIIASANSVGNTTIKFLWYMGLFDSILPLSLDPLPFVFTGSFAGNPNQSVADNNVQGFALTEPGQTAGNTHNFATGAVYLGTSSHNSAFTIPSFANFQTGSLNLYTNQRFVNRTVVSGRSSASNNRFDWMRGLLKDLYNISGGTFLTGDIVEWVWGGVTYSAVVLPHSGATSADQKPILLRV